MSKRLHKKLPKNVAPFDVHGCDMKSKDGNDWIGTCPFCDKEKHFFVSEKTGMWDCKVCGQEGNIITFLTEISQMRAKNTSLKKLKELEKLRGIPAKILRKNKIGYDQEADCWLIPSRSPKNTVRDIRRWDTRYMMATEGCETQLLGAERLAKAKPGTVVWLCEGEWDKMAMEWMLLEAGRTEDVVVALPGATTFKREWVSLFQGKKVYGLFDADDAGDKGIKKAHKLLKGRCKELRFVHWPEQRPKGYDVRDFVISVMGNRGPKVGLTRLRKMLHTGERSGRIGTDTNEAPVELSDGAPLDFVPYPEIVKTFKKNGVLMNDDMEQILLVVLSVCVCQGMNSDPIWLMLVAPPASGKTLLLAGLLGSDMCAFRSTLTPHCLVSGWKGGEDPSLIPQLSGKTFVLKDFTEVLSMPIVSQDEIFSTLRGAYDGSVVKTFGNGEHREYSRHTDPPFEGFNMIAGVTNAIHSRDDASLGERFLKINMRPQSRDYSQQVHLAALDSIGREVKQEDAIQKAVAGFLSRPVTPKDLPRIPIEYAKRLDAIVRLIATLRARVARDQRTQDIQYRPVPEAGTRLMKQLGKLGMAIAYVMGEKEVSEKSFDVIRRVAFDTAYGFHLDLIEAMMQLGGEATMAEVREKAKLPQSTVSRRFDDLVLLRAIEDTQTKSQGPTGRPAKLYRVSKEIRALWMQQTTNPELYPTLQPQRGEKKHSKKWTKTASSSRSSTKKLGPLTRSTSKKLSTTPRLKRKSTKR